jgi:hypothetical protein
VRDNIERALEGRTAEPNYSRSLTGPPDDDGSSGVFTYGPDPGAEAAAPPGFFAGWNKDREVQFMLTTLQGSAAATANLRTVTLDFGRYTEDPDFPATTNLVRYDVEYDLKLNFATEDSTWTDRYGGSAKWDLIGGDRNFWTLLTWEDIAPLEDPDDPFIGTMGTLRALVGR